MSEPDTSPPPTEGAAAPPDAPAAPDLAPEPAASEPAASEPALASDDPGPRVRPSWTFFIVVAVVAAALDLGTKHWASGALTDWSYKKGGVRTIDVIPGWFDFQFAQNPGGAWSMLRSLPEIWRRPFFLLVSTAASVFIANVYGRIDKRDAAMRWGLPLALGGAIGNLVDRIRHGWVVDFIHFYVDRPGFDYHWPTFNVADIWIVAGVGLMAISLFTGRSRLEASEDDDADLAPASGK